MRAVVTRVNSARVTRAETGEVLGEIGKGFLVLLGVHVDDTEKEAAKIADRICGLRVFSLLTGLNLYNKLARFGGAGTLVPITGFSNAVTSPALDFKSED